MAYSTPFPIPEHGETAAVLGLGISNRELVKYLAGRGVTVRAYDKKPGDELGEHYASVAHHLSGGSFGRDYLADFSSDLADRIDWVFVTPGMPKDLPEIEEARRSGARISSELSLFMILCPAPMVGVTGSSGKTTTASLAAAMLRSDDQRVWLGGNIGVPLIDRVDEITEHDVVVLEISSFQLELAERVPQVGVLTNISPNHLDVHRTMDNYVAAKRRMISLQQEGDFMLLNADCASSLQMQDSIRGEGAFFSVLYAPSTWSSSMPLGGWYQEGELWVSYSGEPVQLCTMEEMPLRGLHNASNVLAAAVLAIRMGASPRSIRRAVRNFTPVRHRLEDVGSLDGVLYVNDSIATSPDRTVAGLHSYTEPVVLLLGGYDKGLSFDPLAEELVCLGHEGHIRAVVLMGDTAEQIHGALCRKASDREPSSVDEVPVHRVEGLRDAFLTARNLARPGDVVLMSPACASFDEFPNYVQRGRYFRKLVQGALKDE